MRRFSLHIFEKLATYSLMLLFTFPVLPLPVANMILMIFVITSVVNWISYPLAGIFKNTWSLLLLYAIIPIFYGTELLYASDWQASLALFQRKILLIIFPIGIAFYRASVASFEKTFGKFPIFFIVSILFLIAKTVLLTTVYGVNNATLTSGGWAYAFRTTTEQITKLHPTYLGMFCGFSFLYLMRQLIRKKRKSWIQFGILVLAVFILGFQFSLAARMSIFATMFGFILLILTEVKGRRLLKWSMPVIAAGILWIGWLFVPGLNERLQQGNQSDEKRTTIYTCAESIASENWLFGIQAGLLQPALSTCYYYTNPELFLDAATYNTHNEYLNILCGKGIFALIGFLALLVALAVKSIKISELRYLLIICSMEFLSENVLDRQAGLYFFGLVSSLYAFSNNMVWFKTKHISSPHFHQYLK